MSTSMRTTGGAGSIQVLRSGQRGHFDHGWLDTYHSFSFGDNHDPARMGFRSLRVMNEDRVAPGMGFGTHPHRDIEILTYVLEVTLSHSDSLGNGGPIGPGELQRMTAGTGIMHGERNASDAVPVHFYQIWLLPERKGLAPGYEQKAFDLSASKGRWQLVASKDGREGSLTIHQDASLSLASLAKREQVDHEIAGGRHGWLQVVRGRVTVQGTTLRAGDGAAIEGPSRLIVDGEDDSEVFLFDLG